MMRRWSVPVRAALLAAAAMLVTVFVASVALVVTLRSSLVDEVDRSLRVRAADVVDEVSLPNDFISLGAGNDGRSVVAVVATDDGFVYESSDPAVVGEDVLALAELYDDFEPFRTSLELRRTVGGDNLRAVIAEGEWGTIDPDDPDFDVFDPVVVLLATSLDGVDSTVRQVTIGAWIAGPLLVLLTGLLTFVLTRRALRPVEEIRREVDAISLAGLDRRVPEPPTDDEIGRLARTMNEMLERIDVAQRSQRQFVADASHELRSPLAAIAARLDVASRHVDAVDREQMIAELRSDTARLQRLVEDLLLLARSDAGERVGGQPAQLVDVDDVVLAMAHAVAPRFAGVRFDTSGVSAGVVRGRPEQLERVARNLLDNAGRHAATTVTVTVREHGDRVTLIVDDDGDGVAAADRARIFERFVRADDARSRDAGGSGLGLAIVAEIVEQHGGTVEVSDAPLGGARFRLELPSAASPSLPVSDTHGDGV